jgi:hypothetical protein
MSALTLTPPVSAARAHLSRLKEVPVARSRAARVARLGQVVLGLLWLIDGLLQFQPYMFGKTFITGVLLPNAVGQPGIIASPITWIANLIEPHVAIFNAFAAATAATRLGRRGQVSLMRTRRRARWRTARSFVLAARGLWVRRR